METCRNCGQRTLATLDWACPWCGFPLKRGKRLDVTYAQAVKLRRLAEDEFPESPDNPPVEKAGAEINHSDKPVYVPPVLPETSAEPVLVTQDEEEYLAGYADLHSSNPEIQALQEQEQESEERSEEDVEEDTCEIAGNEKHLPASLAVEEETEAASAVESEELPETCAEFAEEPAVDTVEPEQETASEPVIAIDITVEELMEAYQEDDAGSDARYNNQILALTGVIALVNIRENRDIQYVTLTGADQNIFRSIKCMFNQDKAFQLKGLERGQKLVIMGRFRGSLTSMTLVDCSVI
ncbi:MAG: hypothetical protein WC086_02690 [Dehalococcoidales bacterium]|nr:hypothetical protein [Dehalococcoidales bacterium]